MACLSVTTFVFAVTPCGAGGGNLSLGTAHGRLVKSAAAHARDLGPLSCAESVDGKQLREWAYFLYEHEGLGLAGGCGSPIMAARQ